MYPAEVAAFERKQLYARSKLMQVHANLPKYELDAAR
jgi:hypothetical protein